MSQDDELTALADCIAILLADITERRKSQHESGTRRDNAPGSQDEAHGDQTDQGGANEG